FGHARTIPTYSAADVLENKIPLNKLKDKLIFIGTSSLGLGDLKPTPVQSVFPGLEVQATIAAAILTQHFVYEPLWIKGAELVFILTLGIGLAMIYPFVSSRTVIISSLLLLVSMVIGNFILWDKAGISTSIFLPSLLIILMTALDTAYRYISERNQKKQI